MTLDLSAYGDASQYALDFQWFAEHASTEIYHAGEIVAFILHAPLVVFPGNIYLRLGHIFLFALLVAVAGVIIKRIGSS